MEDATAFDNLFALNLFSTPRPEFVFSDGEGWIKETAEALNGCRLRGEPPGQDHHVQAFVPLAARRLLSWTSLDAFNGDLWGRMADRTPAASRVTPGLQFASASSL